MRITTMRKRARVMVEAVVGVCGTLWVGACQAPSAGSWHATGALLPAATNRVLVTIGKVCGTRPELGYVVVECVSLPLPDEEATVYREGQAVARVRMAGPSRMPFVAADVLEGSPEVGDKVRASRIRTSERDESGKP